MHYWSCKDDGPTGFPQWVTYMASSQMFLSALPDARSRSHCPAAAPSLPGGDSLWPVNPSPGERPSGEAADRPKLCHAGRGTRGRHCRSVQHISRRLCPSGNWPRACRAAAGPIRTDISAFMAGGGPICVKIVPRRLRLFPVMVRGGAPSTPCGAGLGKAVDADLRRHDEGKRRATGGILMPMGRWPAIHTRVCGCKCVEADFGRYEEAAEPA